MTDNSIRGVITPILTPFDDKLEFLPELYVQHAHWLLENGVHYISPFGTTGEALSMSVNERIAAVDALIDGGIDPKRLMPGAGLCNLPETLELVSHAVDRGCAAVMTLPPFFYKNASDEGLYRHFEKLIESVDSPGLKICLYHIPPMAGIGFSPALTERLVDSFADTVVAYKDSSGDFENTRAIVSAAPALSVFPGAETYLKPGLENGCAGCISATCNINPGGIRRVFDIMTGAADGDADAANRDMVGIRKQVEGYAPIPAMKAVLSIKYSEPRWRNVRAPLLAIDEARIRSLALALGF